MHLRLIILLLVCATAPLSAQVDSTYLVTHLSKTFPRLLLTPQRLEAVRSAVASDPEMASYYAAVRAQADSLLEVPPVQRVMTGKRLLEISREALNRNGILAMTYLIDGDRRYLDRLGEEVTAVSAFTDWNPSHFLDVAEMMLAVSLALDWCGEELPSTVTAPAYTALLEKGLLPAMDSSHWWIDIDHNWNQVCHVGTVAAALTLAEREPTLAAAAIDRAITNLPLALATYAPDGAYPEGPGYWAYATFYTIMGSEMLSTALGTDFGIAASPGFLESAAYMTLMRTPTGRFYNYGDNVPGSGSKAAELLAWFARATGQAALYQQASLQELYQRSGGGFSAFAAPALVWLAGADLPNDTDLPLSWTGRGSNPVFVMRDRDESSFYLAGKGGRANINHGNMDAGSFIFELDGVRWSLDLGRRPYEEIEKLGFDLWGREQNAPRWTLLTKSNYGHSTLTVNDTLHRVGGFASLRTLDTTAVQIDMAEIFAGQLGGGATRTFRQLDGRSFSVTDSLQIDSSTQSVTWQVITQAEVELTDYGAKLHQQGKSLELHIERPAGLRFSVVQLDPPPLPYDMQLPGLKRIELRIPAYTLPEESVITVRVTGE